MPHMISALSLGSQRVLRCHGSWGTFHVFREILGSEMINKNLTVWGRLLTSCKHFFPRPRRQILKADDDVNDDDDDHDDHDHDYDHDQHYGHDHDHHLGFSLRPMSKMSEVTSWRAGSVVLKGGRLLLMVYRSPPLPLKPKAHKVICSALSSTD